MKRRDVLRTAVSWSVVAFAPQARSGASETAGPARQGSIPVAFLLSDGAVVIEWRRRAACPRGSTSRCTSSSDTTGVKRRGAQPGKWSIRAKAGSTRTRMLPTRHGLFRRTSIRSAPSAGWTSIARRLPNRCTTGRRTSFAPSNTRRASKSLPRHSSANRRSRQRDRTPGRDRGEGEKERRGRPA
jgi:hypothetical protein